MKATSSLLGTTIALVLMMLGGCGVSPNRAYEGAELDKGQIAKIRTYTFNTVLWDVDQKNLFLIPDQRLATDYVHVQSGRHKVKIVYQSNVQFQYPGLKYNQSMGEVELNAVAGRVYLPRSEVIGGEVRFWLEDGGTDYETRCPYQANIIVQTQRSATPRGC
jgi:hypothetical protein